MIWYFFIGVVYACFSFKRQKFQDVLSKLSCEFIIPEYVLWIVVLISVILWPLAIVLDLVAWMSDDN